MYERLISLVCVFCVFVIGRGVSCFFEIMYVIDFFRAYTLCVCDFPDLLQSIKSLS